MKPFQSNNAPSYHNVDAHMGAANVIAPEDIRDDASLGPGITLSDIPDFSAISGKQIASIDALPTFHQSAAGYYFPQIEAACLAYCRQLREEYASYEGNLITYRNALLDESKRITARLKDMGLDVVHADA